MSNLGQYPNADDELRRVDDPPEVYRSQSDFAPPAHLEPPEKPLCESLSVALEACEVASNALSERMKCASEGTECEGPTDFALWCLLFNAVTILRQTQKEQTE